MITFFLLLEADGRIRTADQFALTTLDLPRERLVGHALHDFLTEVPAKLSLARFLAGELRAATLQTKLVGGNGRLVRCELHLSGVPRKAEGPAVHACVGLLTEGADVFAPSRELSRHLAHEINNSLVAVKGFAQIISRHPTADEYVRKSAMEIFEASQRIAELTGQLRNQDVSAPPSPPAPVIPLTPAARALPVTADPDSGLPLAISNDKLALIVEDDPAIAEVLRYYVRELFRVEILSHPESALEAIAKRRYDVILTDLSMPRIGGAQILAQARRHQPGTPVVIISGYSRHSPEAQDVIAQGADAFLEKPFSDTTAVLNTLRKLGKAA